MSNSDYRFWITGRKGSGKTTLAKSLAEDLGLAVIDGDEVRTATGNTDFTEEGIKKNLYYMTNMALQAMANGQGFVIACVSPIKDMRRMFQAKLAPCAEIYLSGGEMWEGTVYEE